MPKAKTQKQYESELREKQPTVICLGEYTDGHTKTLHKCTKCGKVRMVTPESVLHSKTGCPYCSGNARLSNSEFIKRLKKANPEVEPLDEYKASLKPIRVRCKRCGNEWTTKPNALLNGHGCAACSKSQTSYMEQFILWTLKSLIGEDEVASRNKRAIGMELDIYVPKLKIAIEPGSWEASHKRKLAIDAKKRELCEKKGIRLITLYDSYPNDLEAPFEEDCLTYGVDLGQSGFEAMRTACREILLSAGICEALSESQWEEIDGKAREYSKRRSQERFIEDVAKANPSIQVIGDFKNTSSKVKVRCKVCAHEWEANAGSLIYGTGGCSKCGRKTAAAKKRRGTKEFAELLAEKNPSIELVGEYEGSVERIKVRCRKCGKEWNPKACSLTASPPKGCPHCAAVKAGNAARGMNDEQFRSKLAKANPKVQSLEKYQTSKTKIAFKCCICGTTWKARPYSVLQGHGCPNWRNHK